MSETSRFHAGGNWFFTRFDDGVGITVEDSYGETRDQRWFDKDTWASIVAHVSAKGGTAETFADAGALHSGELVDLRAVAEGGMNDEFYAADLLAQLAETRKERDEARELLAQQKNKRKVADRARRDNAAGMQVRDEQLGYIASIVKSPVSNPFEVIERIREALQRASNQEERLAHAANDILDTAYDGSNQEGA